MIGVEVDGKQVEEYLALYPNAIMVRVGKVMQEWSSQLQDTIASGMNGPRIGMKSGRLLASLRKVTEYGPEHTTVGAAVGLGVPYATIQELGGTTPAHMIAPRTAIALFFFWLREGRYFLGSPGQAIHHPGSRMPARYYMMAPFDALVGDGIAAIHAAVAELVAQGVV